MGNLTSFFTPTPISVDEIIAANLGSATLKAKGDAIKLLNDRAEYSLSAFKEDITTAPAIPITTYNCCVKESLLGLAVGQSHQYSLLAFLLLNLGLKELTMPDEVTDATEENSYDKLIELMNESGDTHFIRDFLPRLEQQFSPHLERIRPDHQPCPGERPSHFEYALMSKLAYKDQKTQANPQIFYKLGYSYSDWFKLGWAIRECVDDSTTTYGATAYINDKSRQLVIANRGTSKLASFSTNSNEVVNASIGGQQQSMYCFTQSVLNKLPSEKQVSKSFADYHLSFTGHSLGGWLASLQVGHFHDQYAPACVTFDAPGSAEMAELTQGQAGHNIKQRNEAWKAWDILAFLTAPNIVNTCGQQVGEIRRIDVELKPLTGKWTDYFKKNLAYNLKELHPMSSILTVFDSETGAALPGREHRVIRWPTLDLALLTSFNVMSIGNRLYTLMKNAVTSFGLSATFEMGKAGYDLYKNLQQLTTQLDTFQAQTTREQAFHVEKERTPTQVFVQKYQAHYEIEEYDPHCFTLRQCHPDIQALIKQFHEHRAALLEEGKLARLPIAFVEAITAFTLTTRNRANNQEDIVRLDVLTAEAFQDQLTQFAAKLWIRKETAAQAIYNDLQRWVKEPPSLSIAKLWKAIETLKNNPNASERYKATTLSIEKHDFIRVANERLKAQYRKHTMITPKFLGKTMPIDECYVKLQLSAPETTLKETAAEYCLTQQIELPHLFDKSKAVFITGPAGYGKTTLVDRIKHQWAADKRFWSQFDWILPIPLRELLHDDYKGLSLAQAINQLVTRAQSITEEDFKPIWEWISANPERVLLIADGADEVFDLPENHHAHKLIKSLLSKDFQRFVTSRPCKLDPIFGTGYTQLQLVGFSDEAINTYLDKAFLTSDNNHKKDELTAAQLNQKKKALQATLQHNPKLHEVARAPINIDMLCYLVQQAEENMLIEEIFSHRTGVYHCLLETRLRENLKKKSIRIENTNYRALLGMNKNALLIKTLTGLAYRARYSPESLDGKRTTFSFNELSSLIDKLRQETPNEILADAEENEKTKKRLIDNCLALGFVSSPGYQKGTEAQHCHFEFVHLSFHEFFAARHIVSLLQKEETRAETLAYIQKHLNHATARDMWPYVAGLLTIETPALCADFFACFGEVDSLTPSQEALAMHCLAEAKLPEAQTDWINLLRQRFTQAIDQQQTEPLNTYEAALVQSPTFLHRWKDFVEARITAKNLETPLIFKALTNLLPSLNPTESILQTLTALFKAKESNIQFAAASLLLRLQHLSKTQHEAIYKAFLLALGSEETQKADVADTMLKHLFKTKPDVLEILCQWHLAKLSVVALEKPEISEQITLLNALPRFITLLPASMQKNHCANSIPIIADLLSPAPPKLHRVIVSTLHKLAQFKPKAWQDIKEKYWDAITHPEKHPPNSFRAANAEGTSEFQMLHCWQSFTMLAKDQKLHVDWRKETLAAVRSETVYATALVGAMRLLQNEHPNFMSKALLQTEPSFTTTSSKLFNVLLRNPIALDVLSALTAHESILPAVQKALLPTLREKKRAALNFATEVIHLLAQANNQQTLEFAINFLLSHFDDNNCSLRWVSINALKALTPHLDSEQALFTFNKVLPSLEIDEGSIRWAARGDALVTIAPRLNTKDMTLAFNALLPYLENNSWAVRWKTIQTLAAIAPLLATEKMTFALNTVQPCLKDTEENVRHSAINALAAIAPRLDTEERMLTFNVLLPYLKDSSWHVLQAAVNALAAIVSHLETEKQLPAFNAVLSYLNDSNWSVREATIEALAAVSLHLDTKKRLLVFNAVLACLKDNNNDVRQAAIDALAAIAPHLGAKDMRLALNTLLPYLKVENSDTRNSTILALATIVPHLGAKDMTLAFNTLLPYLKDSSKHVLQAAVNALAVIVSHLETEKQLPSFKAVRCYLNDSNWSVRQATIEALAAVSRHFDTEKRLIVFNEVLPYLKDNNKDVRHSAIDALAAIAPHLGAKDMTLALDMLLPYLKVENSDVRNSTILTLATIVSHLGTKGMTLAFNTLRPYLKVENSDVCNATILALATIVPHLETGAPPLAFNAVLPYLKSRGHGTCNAATKALLVIIPHLDTKKMILAFNAVLLYLEDRTSSVCQAATKILATITPRLEANERLLAFNAALPYLKNENCFVCQATIQTLASIAPHLETGNLLLAFTELPPYLKDESCSVRGVTIKALSMMASRLNSEKVMLTFDEALSCLKDSNEHVREAAIQALVTIVPHLEAGKRFFAFTEVLFHLKDNHKNVCQAAIEALTAITPYIDTRKKFLAFTEVTPYLKDNNKNVCQAAIEALTAITPYLDTEKSLLAFDSLLLDIINNNNDVCSPVSNILSVILTVRRALLPTHILALWPYPSALKTLIEKLEPEETHQASLLALIEDSALNALTLAYFYSHRDQLEKTTDITEDTLTIFVEWMQTAIWLAHPRINALKNKFADEFCERMPDTLKDKFEAILEVSREYEVTFDERLAEPETELAPEVSPNKQRSPTHMRAAFHAPANVVDEDQPGPSEPRSAYSL